ncbi:MAG: hypothetical protein Q7T32_09845 [Moraxellaceae bacterium]|nr:hypothetical protein [Moraxellaceae bacterium]
MLRKKSSELQFVKSREPLPSVEVNRDVLDAREPEISSYAVAQSVLARFAEEHPSITSTVYTYEALSANFHGQSWSEFLIVAGPQSVLEALHSAYATLGDVPVRFSESIPSSSGIRSYHIQEGRLWEEEEQGVWFSKSTEEIAFDAAQLAKLREQWSKSGAESVTSESSDLDAVPLVDPQVQAGPAVIDDDNFDDEVVDEDDEVDQMVDHRSAHGLRFRRARSDASVGRIRETIEKMFGLPEGSVQLCGPDKSPLRADARIRTLRRRWNYDLAGDA